MADLELALNLDADSGGLRGEVRVAKSELDKLTQTNDKVDKSGRRAGKGLDDGGRGAGVFRRQAQQASRTGLSLGNVLQSVGKMAALAAGLIGGISLAALIGDMTQTIFAAEQMQGALLSAVGGIPEMAARAFAAIEQFAARTPFALDQSVEAFIKMRNLGIRPTEERMAGFGNVAAAMGKSLGQMIEAVADASTAEFERLKEFGIKASQQGDQVRFTFQGVTTTVAKNSEDIVRYLSNIGNQTFGDAMANQMERLPGLWSNLKDNIDGIWRDLGDAGIKDMFSSWIAAGVEWTAGIRNHLKARWFDWVGAELDVLWTKFSGWWDLLEAAGSTYIDLVILEWQTLFSFFDTDAKGAFEQLTTLIGFVGDAIAELPVNIQTFAAIAIGEFGKASASIDEFVFGLANSAQLAWENFAFSIESALLLLKQKAGEIVEYIVNKFGELITELGASLAAINSSTIGDALISDSALDSIERAGAAMQGYSALTEQAAVDIAALNAEHQASVTALEAERAGIEAGAAARRDAAAELIDDALAQRDATLASHAAKVQEAEATAAAARASYEHALAAKAEKVSIDDVTQSSEAKTGATEQEVESLDKLLDRLDPTRAATRQYEESLAELNERLVDGTLSQNQFNAAVAALDEEAAKTVDKQTQSLDRLLDKLDPVRAATREYNEGLDLLEESLAAGKITQDEFNLSVEQLEYSANKAVGGVISEAEALETAWKRGIERIDDTAEGWLKNFFLTGKATFSGVKDLFLEMLAEMIYAAARNQIVLGVTTGGSSLASAGASAAQSAGSSGLSSSLSSGGGSLLSGAATSLQGGFNSLANFYEGSAQFFQAQGWHSAAGAAQTSAGQYTGSLGSSAVNLGLNVGAGIVGTYAGRAVFQNEGSTGIGATVGGIVGSYWGPWGTAIGSFIGEGFEAVVGKVFGFGQGGNNAAFAVIDTKDGSLNSQGIGKNFDQQNLDAATQLGQAINEFAAALGGSTLEGRIEVGNKDGIKFGGQKFKESDDFLRFAFREVIKRATGLGDEVKTLLLQQRGSAESLARDAIDASALEKVFIAGETYFQGIGNFTRTFEILTSSFRRDGESFGNTFLRLETGLALLNAAGKDSQRTVENFKRAQTAIDRIGLETASNIITTINILGDGLAEQFGSLRAQSQRSSIQIYSLQVEQNRRLIEAYNGTTEASALLAQATLARRDAELYLLSELAAVTDAVTGRIAGFREELTLDGLDAEDQYNRLRLQAAYVTELIDKAGSAAQVDALTKGAEQLARSAYGLLDESQQSAARPEFLEWLDNLESDAESRLGTLTMGVVGASRELDTQTQSAVWDKAGLAGENLQQAAGDLVNAGAALQDASETLVEISGQLTRSTGNLDGAARVMRDMVSIGRPGAFS